MAHSFPYVFLGATGATALASFPLDTLSTLFATHRPSFVVTTHSCALDHSNSPASMAVVLTMDMAFSYNT